MNLRRMIPASSEAQDGMTRLEHRLLIILSANPTLMGKFAQAYKTKQKPDDKVIAGFMAIGAVAATRNEYTDVEIVTALASVIETVLQRIGE